MNRYAISDIHGCAKTFRFLVEERLQLQLTDQLYLLGDYIDRGPDSKGVLDFMMELQAKNFKITALMGNHENLLLQAPENPQYLTTWLRNGGQTTLQSFNAPQVADISAKYLNFIAKLDYYHELPDYLLVHAGFNFKAANPFTDFEAMIWIRHFEVKEKFTQGRRIVHGHTPTMASEIMASIGPPAESVINIDGGCVYSWPPGLGKLVALNLDTLEVIMVDNRDDF
ncbi:metallophosphoesterase family protein [Adhaeribacter pallidiroseus]|uniref:Protein-serine/threonine phosphatase n=1 Tax=Adhaeribacter pallidiroseus TaxID=2072847 RepID=A0A369QJ71_9BACT|nr:metallophosphoesterase family protein [Adhaeribacter pallidiroseus]RDC63655.1 Protein-serine/threonine phosphatase [Adhaeribacter pallidiroseus]